MSRQSHTFSRARGVPVYINGSVSDYHLQQASTSSASHPRSTSVFSAVRHKKKEVEAVPLPPTYVARFHNEAAVRRMRYARLGQTEMIVSQLALGCGPIGGLFGDLEDSITQIVETTLRDGVNLIDTAYWYGQARSETILGRVLSKIPRPSYYICTKVGRFELDFVRAFDFRADKILESLMESLKRLRLTYVDVCFLQIHDVEFEANERIVLFETLQALEMAKLSGKVRHIGITGYSLAKVAKVVELSQVPIEVVMTYCHGSLNDNSLGRYTAFFQSRSIGLLNASCLSMGLLTQQGPPPWHPANPLIRETVAAAVEYCSSKKISIERLALDYGIHFPGCASCFVGLDSIAHVRMAIEMCCERALSDLESRVRDRIMRRYLDTLENANWEGLDTATYWRRLKKLGLPALATHRHSSVESLASTLNGLSMRSTTSSSDLRSTSRMSRGSHRFFSPSSVQNFPTSRSNSILHK